MNRNILYLIIGGLAVATLGLGYYLYQEQQNTAAIEIKVSNPYHSDHDRGHEQRPDRGPNHGPGGPPRQ